jgi:hypothetical protein
MPTHTEHDLPSRRAIADADKEPPTAGGLDRRGEWEYQQWASSDVADGRDGSAPAVRGGMHLDRRSRLVILHATPSCLPWR